MLAYFYLYNRAKEKAIYMSNVFPFAVASVKNLAPMEREETQSEDGDLKIITLGCYH